ncbi:hypothetical protein TorRG33x02_134010, partial [Trema orientale]
RTTTLGDSHACRPNRKPPTERRSQEPPPEAGDPGRRKFCL